MDTGVLVRMRLDATVSSLLVNLDQSYGRYMDDRGCIVVLLKEALHGCVESAALWNKDLSKTMESMGYTKNPYEQCFFNRSDEDGIQCTAAVHVDDLLITCTKASMVNKLCQGLKSRYGTITRRDGPRIKYLGMAIDLSFPGEARISMRGYVEVVLKNAGIEGTAKTPATDGLFKRRDRAALVPEVTRAKFHRLVATISYLAKRTMPEALTTTEQLATQVTRCTVDDYEKLERLVRYIRYTRCRGVVQRPGALGIVVKIFVDAAYGVQSDMRSHTGSCVVIGDTGAVHCRSSK
jgi:hypothetical protein